MCARAPRHRYVALYCLLAMVITLLGTMHLASIPLGVTSALALSLVIGMSVDYIIHIAHAYKNSIFADRFYKSRATVFARASSITSAAGTTLVAVAPMLAAQLLPLREFGQIFFLVTIVSLAFSLAFLVTLMIVGPRATRGLRSAAVPQDDEEEAPPPAITEPISEGDGWALQLNDARSVGVEQVCARARGVCMRALSRARCMRPRVCLLSCVWHVRVCVEQTGPRRTVEAGGSEASMHPRRSGMRVDDDAEDELL